MATNKNEGGLFWIKFFFHAPMAAIPAIPAPKAEPKAANAKANIAPKSRNCPFIPKLSISFSLPPFLILILILFLLKADILRRSNLRRYGWKIPAHSALHHAQALQPARAQNLSYAPPKESALKLTSFLLQRLQQGYSPYQQSPRLPGRQQKDVYRKPHRVRTSPGSMPRLPLLCQWSSGYSFGGWKRK